MWIYDLTVVTELNNFILNKLIVYKTTKTRLIFSQVEKKIT